MNLNQVTLPSLDVATAIAFYQSLGLRLIVRSLPKYARFECPQGDSTLSIHLVDQLPKGPGITIYFECNELDRQVKALQSKGISFVELPADRSWLWREAHLVDPDQNKIILYSAGVNRKNPPWRLQ